MTKQPIFGALIERENGPPGLGHWDFGHSTLPFDFAQGGEPVEPFRVSDFACLRRSGFAQAGASKLTNQSKGFVCTLMESFLKALSFGWGFFTSRSFENQATKAEQAVAQEQ